ncbi:MAG: general secretion pathway protein GspB [Candidatus Omnitrophica bacterium]|nr:general secretion pathway protein GspB [Candidatus Omnitrophota bacterium]
MKLIFKVFFCVIGYWLLVSSCSFGEEFYYDPKGKRDPFIPLVGTGTGQQKKEAADILSIEDVVLEGIVYDERGGSMAVINGTLLKEGVQVGLIMVDKIEPKKVILRIEDKRYEVPLVEKKVGE